MTREYIELLKGKHDAAFKKMKECEMNLLKAKAEYSMQESEFVGKYYSYGYSLPQMGMGNVFLSLHILKINKVITDDGEWLTCNVFEVRKDMTRTAHTLVIGSVYGENLKIESLHEISQEEFERYYRMAIDGIEEQIKSI